jgi:uncharacterized protein
MGTVVLKKASNNQFHFRLEADNGETIQQRALCGESRRAHRCRVGSRERHGRCARRTKDRAEWSIHVQLEGRNHEVIGTIETYTTGAARDHGIASVTKNAPKATLDDQT